MKRLTNKEILMYALKGNLEAQRRNQKQMNLSLALSDSEYGESLRRECSEKEKKLHEDWEEIHELISIQAQLEALEGVDYELA